MHTAAIVVMYCAKIVLHSLVLGPIQILACNIEKLRWAWLILADTVTVSIINFLQVLLPTMELLPLPPWVLERGPPINPLPPHLRITATPLQLGGHHHGVHTGASLPAPRQG